MTQLLLLLVIYFQSVSFVCCHFQPGKTIEVLFVYRATVGCLALMPGLADRACLVYQVRKASLELADQDRRVSPEDQVLMDLMEGQVERVPKACQACYLRLTTCSIASSFVMGI